MFWSHLNSHNVSVDENADIDLPCAISAQNVVWTYTSSSGYFQLLENKLDLRLSGIKVDQAGIYECTDKNNSNHKRVCLKLYYL